METTENSSASAELTSTLTDSNDATQTLTGDSVPSSSSDANLGSSYSKTIQDDPISSTSDSVSTYNFNDEKEDFFSSDLNIENIRTEKINEDVEDIATDLENLLGETSNDYLIPLNKNKEKGVSTSPTNIDGNDDNKIAENQEVDSTNKKYIKNDEIKDQKESTTLDSTSCSESNILENSLNEGTNLDVNGKIIDVNLVNVRNDDKLGGEKVVGSSEYVNLESEVNLNDAGKEEIEKSSIEDKECPKEAQESLMESQECLKDGQECPNEVQECPNEVQECSKEVQECPKEVQECLKEVEEVNKAQNDAKEINFVQNETEEIEKVSEEVQEVVKDKKDDEVNDIQVQESENVLLPEISLECKENEIVEKKDKNEIEVESQIKMVEEEVEMKPVLENNELKEINEKNPETLKMDQLNESDEKLDDNKQVESEISQENESDRKLDDKQVESEITQENEAEKKLDDKQVEDEIRQENESDRKFNVKQDESGISQENESDRKLDDKQVESEISLENESNRKVVDKEVESEISQENESDRKLDDKQVESEISQENESDRKLDDKQVEDEIRQENESDMKLDDKQVESEISQENEKIEVVVSSESGEVSEIDQVDDKKVELEAEIKPCEPFEADLIPLESGEPVTESSDDFKESKKIEEVESTQSGEMDLQESDVPNEVDDKIEDKKVVLEDVAESENVNVDSKLVNIEEVLIQRKDEVKEKEKMEEKLVESSENVQEKIENINEKIENVQEMEVENVSEVINETIQSKNVNNDENLLIKTVNEDEKSEKMTITSIIEEAIQEEMDKVEIVSIPEIVETENPQNEIKIPDESQSLVCTIENTEVNDQTTSEAVPENINIEQEIIKEEEKVIEVPQILEETDLKLVDEQKESDKVETESLIQKVLELKENKIEIVEEKELDTKNFQEKIESEEIIELNNSENVESSQICDENQRQEDTLTIQDNEIPMKSDDSDLKQDESYNTQSEIVQEKIKSISVIPDSLDEGNIAALAICEPSNMEYYHIDLTQTDNKSVVDTPVIEYEKDIESVHVEERIRYPTADDTEVIATAAALTANQTQSDEMKIEVNKDVNKDNLEILDIEEENVVVQHIIETTKINKSSRNKSMIEQESQKSNLLPQISSQSCSQIQPLVIDVESPVIEGKEEEVLTPQYSSKMSTKEVLKLTITKHKIDSPKEEDSILKIYDPKDQKSQKKDVIPKLIIKPVRPQSPQIDEQEQSIPKLLIRNMSPNRPCSPKVKHQKIETSSSSSSLKVTIKPVVKTIKNDEENFTPKITIKPIVKPEDEPKISPRITIKPLIRPDDDSKDYKDYKDYKDLKDLKDDDRSHSPRITIKPIKGDDGKMLNEEMVHSPRITIKPIKPPDDEECSPKITIKPLIKPQEEDRHEKKEGSPKIKIKPIVKPVDETLESIDFEDQIKQERIVLKINTKESRKREASEEIEKLAKIKLKFSKEGGHAHIVSDQKLKRGSEQSHDSETKRAKIDLIDLPSFSEKEIEVKDNTSIVEDPIDAIPTFQINTQSQQKQNLQPQVQSQIVAIPPVVVPPPPRKRGRPRKIPLVVREEFKDPKDEETEVTTPVVEDTGRPKRSCRGPSVCTTLGIKPRKPRGGGAGTRGRGRGRGSRGGSRGGNRQQRVSTRSKLLLEEEIVETSDYRRLAVDEIIEIPDDDPKEEEHPPQPLPPTHHHHHREVIESPPGVDDTGNTESVTGEKISSDGGSDVVLIEEETRMSADIHSSRAHTPAKVLAVADIDDTQSSVQSTATTESVKVRKGSRLEVHPEQDDIISPDQLAEYYWSGSGPYMIQEQVAQFLGIKSFKRKYPGIQRRPVDMQERDFIRESCLASEAMCDMGLTAVASADILDIMYSDFQPKYEEYCKHQRDRHTKDIINKQKALNLVVSQEKSKHDLTQQAMQSAASWNLSFNRTRKEDRKACMDLQTFTINYPKGRFKVLDKGKVGSYPIALVPGQYTDHYKEYSPNEIYNLPLNTMMNQTLSIVRDDDDSQSDGSGSDSDTTSSDSDSSSSDSSDEDCNLCTNQMGPRKVSAN
ncbi:uncharacterized protein [Onthophagus taurus]|uniref:uncharacterized protein n=1 Tax=Onthophagus taurus TaxID=166361 RepID=UPI0039BDCA2D